MLRSAWQIHVGDSREILPQLLNQLYEHMMWEFEIAYLKIQHRGLLVSDDAFWNNSFYDFAHKAGASKAQVLRGVGFLRKNSV
jgi:hypothetical protein